MGETRVERVPGSERNQPGPGTGAVDRTQQSPVRIGCRQCAHRSGDLFAADSVRALQPVAIRERIWKRTDQPSGTQIPQRDVWAELAPHAWYIDRCAVQLLRCARSVV